MRVKLFLFITKIYPRLDIEDTQDGQDPSREPVWHDEDLFRLPLTPDIEVLPKLNDRSNVLNSDPFRRRPSLRTQTAGSCSKSSGWLRSPDRFLPNRSPLDALSQRYHANKESNKLSNKEKLLRRDIASLDAFSPRRRATSPTPLPASLAPEQLFRRLHVGGKAERLAAICHAKPIQVPLHSLSAGIRFPQMKNDV